MYDCINVIFFKKIVEFDSETSDRMRERHNAVEKHPEIGKGPKSFNGETLILPSRLVQLEHKYGKSYAPHNFFARTALASRSKEDGWEDKKGTVF